MKTVKYLFCFLSICAFAQNNTVADKLGVPGIAKELAVYRKQQLSDVHYMLSFAIPRNKTEQILSKLQLECKVSNLLNPLFLDFNEKKEHLKSVQVNGKMIPVMHKNQHLIVSPNYLKLGKNTITIDFIAGNLSLNRNDDYLYTLLVPDRASTLFPCFDQPDLKAKYTLTITAPGDWKVQTAAAVEKQIRKANSITYKFRASDKMSTYLFSFIAGKFNEVKKNPRHFDITMLYRETDTAKIKASIDEAFNLHEKSLSFLEEYTKVKFPFQKFDFATIPSHPFGGMEHVGAIQYKESSVFLDNSATSNEKLSRAKLIGHETAHMWFGDLVTMKWFDDVWMKEVFANFMAAKIMNPAFPEINHNLQFLLAHYPNAYDEDRTLGTHPIRQNLENLKDAGSLYGNIIYNKAPIMMQQLEVLIGAENFQKGVQKYIQQYANDNADWDQLVAILDQETPVDLKQWSKVWVNESGRPIISSTVEYDTANHIKNFEISQRAEDGSDKLWPQTFEIALVYDNEIKVQKVDLNTKKLSLSALNGLLKPNFIIYNYNGYGYGVFPLNEAEIDKIASIKDDVARAAAYINLNENVQAASVAPTKVLTVLLKDIAVESNELIVQELAGNIRANFWDYLTIKQQQQFQNKIEEGCYALLQTDKTSNVKKILFNLFASVAYSDSGKERLYGIWNKTDKIEALRLNEDDYEKMAMLLSLYQHPKAVEILAQTLAETKNPDRKNRLEFLMPALSNDVAVRDAFMQSFKDEKNRVHGNWVITALSYMNHPLRQQNAQKDLRLCLDMLPEVQRTGDLFFPKSWLSVTIGNYTSTYALEIVESYLSENPNMNPMLKRKLLQATDALYRAQKIKKDEL
ncbi:M1 family aminopeptidase [Flavobacterium flavipallidum]|uniref:Aminopeptidase N n=1 Tax=Flavobacterium flavipallidum TaxID=3139140 RepID=A0ABU9HL80_9FLAO